MLSTNQKIGVGIGAALGIILLGSAYLSHASDKKAEAEKKPGETTPKPGEPTTPATIDPIYSAAPALHIDVKRLPLAEQRKGGGDTRTVWVLQSGDWESTVTTSTGKTTVRPSPLFDDELLPLATASNQFAMAYGYKDPAQTPPLGTPLLTVIDSDNLLFDASTSFANGHGIETGTLVFALGPTQKDVSVPLALEYIKNLRTAVGPQQRMLFLLDTATPASIAKALSDAQEEWFRTAHSGNDIVRDLYTVLTATDLTQINDVLTAGLGT